jgi:malate dehydrogenase (oxaloacetate-decarboxylating)
VKKRMEDSVVVVNGAGSAGTSITKMILNMNPKDVLLCDRQGILHSGTPYNDQHHKELAAITNKHDKKGNLKDAMTGADVFIGVSAANIVTVDMVECMNQDAIIFAMANPVPEIMPDLAKAAGARVIGSGRSDFPNQVNNVLAFPGVFRGALDVRARDINEEMKLAAAYAIADIISEDELTEEYVIPDVFDKRVVEKVAAAVVKAAIATKVAGN